MAIVWNLGAIVPPSPSGIEVLFDAASNGVVSNAFSEGFIMKDGDNIIVFHGNFIGSGGVIQSGTITGFEVYYQTFDNALVSASGYAIDFSAFSQATAYYIAFFGLMFGADMTVNGADQVDFGPLSEIFYGSTGADHLYGNGGSDMIADLGGADLVYGGAGNDEISESSALVPGGNDFVYGGDGDDTIGGGGGDDFISGGSGADKIDGEEGADTADYSEKAETVTVILNGPTEVDVLIGGFVEDKISNIENVNGGQANDSLTGDGLNNRLAGALGNDKLFGGDGSDTLLGGGGRDKIDGGAGADTISGGEGRDALKGGTDEDTFVFDFKAGSKNLDKVKDFSVRDDTIALDDVIFAKLDLGALKAKFFHIGDSAGDGNDWIVYDDQTGGLYYDKDGAGGAAQKEIAKLDAHLHLTHQDFLIV